jgi:hypothetical protein
MRRRRTGIALVTATPTPLLSALRDPRSVHPFFFFEEQFI